MAEVYRRYFRVATGPLIEGIAQHFEVKQQAEDQYKQIIEEVGAGDQFYHRRGRLSAFTFPNGRPDKGVFKEVEKGWYPRKNTKAGKQLAARLDAIKTSDEKDCLAAIGLRAGPIIMTGMRAYFACLTIVPYKDGPVGLISVPWYDEDPEKLAAYVKDKKAGHRFDSNLSALLWKPTPDMEEIKEWQVKKEINDYNESLVEVAL